MRKICVTIKSLADGGAEKQSLLLTCSLQEKYETHLVIISDRPKLQKHLDVIEKEKISHIFLQGNLLQRFLAFRSFLRDRKVDIIFSFLPGDTVFGALAGKLDRVPYLFGGIRNSCMEKHKLIGLKYLHNYVLDYSISNCYSGSKECVKQGFKKEKMLVIPNGIELQSNFFKRPNKQELIITTIGRFVEQKDYHTAIRSIAYLSQNYDFEYKITYRIIGQGSQEEQIKNWIEEYKIKDSTELIISPTNITQILEQSDIYLCTSLFEGISNAIMEAMNYGLPIVATQVGDNYRLVENQVNGYLTEQQDYAAIAAALYELIKSYGRRIEFGRNSFNKLKKDYSIDRFKNDYINLIENIE